MITILTPTYNRGYILSQAYESLRRQTDMRFEWIVVDDGSADNTEGLVCGWEKESPFPIVYHKQPNGGKHRALNRGVALAKAEYILILDSDDYLTDDAVEKIHSWIESIRGLDKFAGVSGLRGWKNRDTVIGGSTETAYVDATNLQRRKLKMTGDKAEVYKTELMKRYPFPEFEGENFLRESAVWDRIAQEGYKIRWFNEIIYKCEYLEDGLTKNTNEDKLLKNFQGFTYCTKLYIETRSLFFALLQIGRYAALAKKASKNKKEICNLLGIGRIKLGVAQLLYGVWKLMGKS